MALSASGSVLSLEHFDLLLRLISSSPIFLGRFPLIAIYDTLDVPHEVSSLIGQSYVPLEYMD